jgi:UDP-N-acetylglucosamine--N-acetylmuramyl-(pentapeptide) pyrophosphoryl-undecaprenol N-acetylglucosamine transferase
MALGLDPNAPVLLIMGGSQGATAINQAVIQAIPALVQKIPNLQFLHLAGAGLHESVAAAYRPLTSRAKVLPFLTEMDMALAASTIAISRAGASSLAEFAAMELPAILIPYPTAADDHQYHNARALAQPGAARMIVQSQLRPEMLVNSVSELILDPFIADKMRAELRKWHYPDAADQIAEALLRGVADRTAGETHHGILKLRTG